MRLITTKKCSRKALTRQTPQGLALDLDGPLKLPDGFPLILDSSGGLHWGAFCFLLDVYRLDTTRDRRKTLQTYAESLKNWLQYLEATQEDWTSPAPRTMSDYRAALTIGHATCRGSGRPAANTTVNLRTAVVKEFYSFLVGWDGRKNLDASTGIEIEPIKRFVAAIQKQRPAKGYRKRPRSLTKAEVRAIANALDPTYSLIFRWTIATGMRRSTAVCLTLAQLPKPVGDLGYVEVVVKGGKTIEVPVSSALLDVTSDYIATTRAVHLSRSRNSTDQVFVDVRGRPISSRGYYQAFRRAAKSLHINATPHCSRHTFAVHMKATLDRLAANGAQLNPSKVLQHILGHSSVKTTEIYLGSVSAVDAGVLRALIETDGMLA